jgi:ATP-dependent Lon protease
MSREIELLIVQQKIQSEARGEIDKTQREYFLREQLKAIQKELGDIDERAEEVKEFRKKIEDAKMPEKVLSEAEKQLKRLEKMHPESAEAGTIRTYLDWLVELPWAKSTKDNLDIKGAKKVLNDDHYDLEKVKERILEYLSVRKTGKMKSFYVLLVRPESKTSGRSMQEPKENYPRRRCGTRPNRGRGEHGRHAGDYSGIKQAEPIIRFSCSTR